MIVTHRSPIAQRKQKGKTEQKKTVVPAQQKKPGKKQTVPASQSSATASPKPAPPDPLPPAWAGIDRMMMPRLKPKKKQKLGNLNPDWMNTLLENSNLRVCGAYAGGPVPAGEDEKDFTSSSRQAERGWLEAVDDLVNQGWGIVFWYVGYSIGGGHPAPAKGTDAARGELHGQHLRELIKGLGKSWYGSVIMIDNEDGEGTKFTKELKEYYEALFAEMERYDSTLPALRPGMYMHLPLAPQLIDVRPDLFIWDVHYDHGKQFASDTPFGAKTAPMTIDIMANKRRWIRAGLMQPSGQPVWTFWALGNQFRRYSGKLPPDESPLRKSLPNWKQEKEWDFDSSLVRNPAFPAAEPRIAALQNGTTTLLLRGKFIDKTGGNNSVPPMQQVESITANGSASAFSWVTVIEPEAPLSLLHCNGEPLAFSNSAATLQMATRLASGSWTQFAPIQPAKQALPDLRNPRAFAGGVIGTDDLHLFFVTHDDQLYALRKQGSNAWSDKAEQTNGDLIVHPFSALAVTARGSATVDAFFLDHKGRLTTVYWASWFKTWPDYRIQRLEAQPVLLLGGSLAAISPQADHILLFGVNRNLQLVMKAFFNGPGWGSLTSLGKAEEKIFAHTKLAVHAVSATEVEVAAITDRGNPCIYKLTWDATAQQWNAAARTVINLPTRAFITSPPAPTAKIQPAKDWRINPYTDLTIVRESGQTQSTLFCAGLLNAKHGLLRCRLASGPGWEVIV